MIFAIEGLVEQVLTSQSEIKVTITLIIAIVAEINMTPMIDIMLVLLIIFMVLNQYMTIVVLMNGPILLRFLLPFTKAMI